MKYSAAQHGQQSPCKPEDAIGFPRESWMSYPPLGSYKGEANLREYVGDDPVNEIDPTGEQGEKLQDLANKGIKAKETDPTREKVENRPYTQDELQNIIDGLKYRRLVKSRSDLEALLQLTGKSPAQAAQIIKAWEESWNMSGPFPSDKYMRRIGWPLDLAAIGNNQSKKPSITKSSITFTLPPHPDYAGFSRVVDDPSAIVFDILLSGSPDEAARGIASPLLGGVFEPKTFFGAMEGFCKKKYGQGWKPVPVEFRLTSLEFYPTTKSGGRADAPRRGTVKIPVLTKKDGDAAEFKQYEVANVPLAHFLIEGFWVFKCTNGKETSPLYAIPTEGKVHTWVHAPYDKQFSRKMEEVRGSGTSTIGRSYDRLASGMTESALKSLDRIFKYLKIAPGNKGDDLEIVKLSDIWNHFEFPN